MIMTKKKDTAMHKIVLAFLKEEARIIRIRSKLIKVFFHTLLMLVLTILLQYTSFIRIDEIDFLKWAAILKHDVFKVDEKPWKNNIVFIDVSKDPAVADDEEYGPPDSTLKGAQRVITDRYKLNRLFSILNQHPNAYQYVICDVLFEKPGPGDELLKPQIEKLKHVICSAIWDQNKLVKPIYNVP